MKLCRGTKVSYLYYRATRYFLLVHLCLYKRIDELFYSLALYRVSLRYTELTCYSVYLACLEEVYAIARRRHYLILKNLRQCKIPFFLVKAVKMELLDYLVNSFLDIVSMYLLILSAYFLSIKSTLFFSLFPLIEIYSTVNIKELKVCRDVHSLLRTLKLSMVFKVLWHFLLKSIVVGVKLCYIITIAVVSSIIILLILEYLVLQMSICISLSVLSCCKRREVYSSLASRLNCRLELNSVNALTIILAFFIKGTFFHDVKYCPQNVRTPCILIPSECICYYEQVLRILSLEWCRYGLYRRRSHSAIIIHEVDSYFLCNMSIYKRLKRLECCLQVRKIIVSLQKSFVDFLCLV